MHEKAMRETLLAMQERRLSVALSCAHRVVAGNHAGHGQVCSDAVAG